jgi:tetratricopeptide (TPR) repeat protein
MRPLEAREFLQRTPIMGAHLPKFQEAIQTLNQDAYQTKDRETALLVLEWNARTRHALNMFDAAVLLEHAATQLEKDGLSIRALALKLLRVRCLAGQQQTQSARTQLSQVISAAGSHPELAADWRLAAASLIAHENRDLLEQALRHLSPSRDHDRLEVFLSLADIAERGADLPRAHELLAQALQISEAHADQVHTALISALLGNLCLCMGRSEEALPFLIRAFELALELNDPLSTLAQGSILCAQLQANGDYTAAQSVGEKMLTASTLRKNWIGQADAHIQLANCALELQGVDAGVQLLCESQLTLMKCHASQATLNLIFARLAEIRRKYGAERIDSAIRKARDH